MGKEKAGRGLSVASCVILIVVLLCSTPSLWAVKTDDNDALEDSYQFFSRLVPQKPYPSLDAGKEALAELGEKDPKVRSAKAEEFVEMSVIKEFDDNGFIDGLYKKRSATILN